MDEHVVVAARGQHVVGVVVLRTSNGVRARRRRVNVVCARVRVVAVVMLMLTRVLLSVVLVLVVPRMALMVITGMMVVTAVVL